MSLNLNLESAYNYLSDYNIITYLFLRKHNYLGNIYYSDNERYVFNNLLFKSVMQDVRCYNFHNARILNIFNILESENFNKFTSYLLENNSKFKKEYKGVTE